MSGRVSFPPVFPMDFRPLLGCDVAVRSFCCVLSVFKNNTFFARSPSLGGAVVVSGDGQSKSLTTCRLYLFYPFYFVAFLCECAIHY